MLYWYKNLIINVFWFIPGNFARGTTTNRADKVCALNEDIIPGTDRKKIIIVFHDQIC